MVSEEEIAPFCHLQGCSCADGYELIEYAIKQVCRKIDQSEGSNNVEGEDEKCKYTVFIYIGFSSLLI